MRSMAALRPTMEAGLRPAEQLVAGEGDDVATGRQHLLRQRLAGQAVGRQIDQ